MTPLRQAESVTTHDELERLGKRLKGIRAARGYSQGDVELFSDRTITGPGVSRIESGQRKDMALSTLITLAKVYDCDFKIKRDGTIDIHGTALNPEETK